MTRDELHDLVRLHQVHLIRYLRFLGAIGPETAEDLAQETFVAAFRRPERIPADAREQAAWLRGIARNLFLADCRRRRRAPVALDEAALESAERHWRHAFLRDGDGFEYLEALRECLARLPSDRRRLVELRYAEGQGRQDLAETLGMTENGIKTALRRVRAALADCIESRLGIAGSAP